MNTRFRIVFSLLGILALAWLAFVLCRPGLDSPADEAGGRLNSATQSRVSGDANEPEDTRAVELANTEKTEQGGIRPTVYPKGKVLAMREEALSDNLMRRTFITDYGRPELPVRTVEKGKVNDEGELEPVSYLEMAAHRIIITPASSADIESLENIFPGARLEPLSKKSWVVSSSQYDLDTVPALLSVASESESVHFAEPDYIVRPSVVPNDPFFSSQWGLRNTGQSGGTAGADISAVDAWDYRRDASNVIIAIADSGINTTHEDLAGNLWMNPGEVPGDGIDNDGNGVVDDIHGYNPVFNNGNVSDTDGHGTHVAGIAAAVGNNGVGMTGVAWNTQLMAGRFLISGYGSNVDAVRAIDYATENGAQIINASWGGPGNSFTLAQAVQRAADAGVAFVAAAGNQSQNNDFFDAYPANYNSDNVVSVGSSDRNDVRSSFSNFGAQNVDLFAPGSAILSTYIGSDRAYDVLSGTSMASPYVAGMLALMAAAYPQDTYVEWSDRIMNTVDQSAGFTGLAVSEGRANLEAALRPEAPVSPPVIDQPITDRSAIAGEDILFAVSASGSVPLVYVWQKNGEIIAGEGESSLSLNAVSASDAGTYRVTVSNSVGSVSSSAVLTVNSQVEALGAALDASGLNWQTSGDTPWRPQDNYFLFGTNALSSGNISDGQSTALQTTIQGPGTACFWWRISSEEAFDQLHFYVDDVLEGSISGETTWKQVCLNLTEGTHVLKWVYSKDATLSVGDDAGYIDGFSFASDQQSGPTVLSGPASKVLAPGSQATFSVEVEGAEPIRYQWYRGDTMLSNGGRISGADSSTLVVASVTDTDVGLYHVTVANAAGQVTSPQAQLTLFQALPPSITAQPGAVTARVGDTITLSVEADGSEPFAYQWFKNSSVLEGQSGPELNISDAVQSDSGSYTVRVANSAGTVTSDIAVVQVFDNSIVPLFLKHPQDTYTRAGETVELRIQVSGTEPIKLQWYKDGKAITGQVGAVLTLEEVEFIDAGVYTVEATNEFGSTTSHAGQLIVLEDTQETFLNAVDAESSGLLLEAADGVPWSVIGGVPGSVEAALSSGEVTDGGSSILRAYIVGSGTLIYRWRVSSQKDADFLELKVDGVTEARISGEQDWETRSITLDAGKHRLDWVYIKDANISQGDDRGYIDRLFLGDGLEPLSAQNYFPGAVPGDDGWLFVPGLGFLWGEGFRWVYHEDQTWWFLSEAGGNGFWAYDPGLGWVYSETSLYPFIYSDERSVWLYYVEDSSFPRVFVNTETNTLVGVF